MAEDMNLNEQKAKLAVSKNKIIEILKNDWEKYFLMIITSFIGAFLAIWVADITIHRQPPFGMGEVREPGNGHFSLFKKNDDEGPPPASPIIPMKPTRMPETIPPPDIGGHP